MYNDSPIEDWDASLVDSMAEIFFVEDDIFTNCNPDLSSWDTSSATDFVSFCAFVLLVLLYGRVIITINEKSK